MLLGRCEFGKEDYSLNIVNLPADENAADMPYNGEAVMKDKRSVQEISNRQTSLFD